MKKLTLRVICVLFALTLLLSASVGGVSAVSYANDLDIKSKSVLLVSMDTGQTVFERNADEKMYPASTTKIMTYIIAYENIPNIEEARIEIKKPIIDKLRNTGSSMAFLSDHVGEKVSGKDLLYSLMVPSGNDAAMVLADYVGNGDVKVFVDKMNAKAKELGCQNTHFANPDGLHNKDHYTTARDLLIITEYALTLPNFETISNTDRYKCEGDDTSLVTTNGLIDSNSAYYYTYAKGIKTGTTDEAGRCLVTTASADGQSYILILLGAPYKEGVQEDYFTFTDAADLFRWCLVQLKLESITSRETPMCEAALKYVMNKETIQLYPEHDVRAVVPEAMNEGNLEYEYDLPEYLEAPLKKGETVGTASVYYKDPKTGEKQLLQTVNLVTGESVDRSIAKTVWDVFHTILKSYWFPILIGVIVLVVVIYLIAASIHRKRKRKRRDVKHYRNF